MNSLSMGAGASLLRRGSLLVLAFAALLAATPSRAVTVTWTGADNFNNAAIFFAPITANKLTDISGDGQYEGCCAPIVTFPPPFHFPHITPVPVTFTLQLFEGSSWVTIDTWTYSSDSIPKSLSSLVGPTVSFAQATFTGLQLLSSPAGTPSNDFNFTNFNYVTKKCGGDDDDEHHYKSDDDYGCKFVTHAETFKFKCVECTTDPGGGAPPGTTPLPAAAWLFGSVLAGGAGVRRWRKKRAERTAAV